MNHRPHRLTILRIENYQQLEEIDYYQHLIIQHGNAKSMNRAEIEEAAASGKWDNNIEVLSVVQDVQAKKKRSRRKSTKKERPMELSEIDEIYDLVLSLKNGGKEGEDLLNKFVQQQTRRSSITRPPPVQSIMIDNSSRSNTAPPQAA